MKQTKLQHNEEKEKRVPLSTLTCNHECFLIAGDFLLVAILHTSSKLTGKKKQKTKQPE